MVCCRPYNPPGGGLSAITPAPAIGSLPADDIRRCPGSDQQVRAPPEKLALSVPVKTPRRPRHHGQIAERTSLLGIRGGFSPRTCRLSTLVEPGESCTQNGCPLWMNFELT